MEKKGNIQTFVIIMLTVAIVAMSIGFALADIELTLTGDTTVKSSSWNVHFKANSFTPNSGSETATNISIDDTTVTYNIVLNNVGDIFDYNVVVENTGSFDAVLKRITITDISTHSNYLSFKVNYNGKDYSNPTNDILAADANRLVATSGTETINLRAEYLKPADAANLPTADTSVEIVVTLVYGEAPATN